MGIPTSKLSFDLENNINKFPDNNSPEILDINLNKNQFNLADGDQNLSIEVKVKDDLVGVGNSNIIFNNDNVDYGNIFGILTFTGPNNQSLPILLSAKQLTSGDLNEGTFMSSFELPNDISSGKWNLTDFRISDKNNNIYSSPSFLSSSGGYEDSKYNNSINREHFLEELALSLGLDQSKLTFEVKNGLTQESSDTEAPSITSFEFIGNNSEPEPIGSGAVFTDRESLDIAIAAWIDNETSATETYGDINTWDVSAITDFSELFQNKKSFNDDISNWDVSSGVTFYAMFDYAELFNQDIGSWDVSSGLTFNAMFYNATLFNQDISSWNVSSSRNFQGMFSGAMKFDQNLSAWDVSSGTNFSAMFSGADLMQLNHNVSSTPDLSYFTKKEIITEPEPEPVPEAESLSLDWTKLLGSSADDSSTGITTASDGSIYVTGSTNGNLDGQTNTGLHDAFISKLIVMEIKFWTKLLGSSNDDESWGITTANDGSIYVTGSYQWKSRWTN